MTATLLAALKAAADTLQGTGVTLLLKLVSDAKGGFLTRAADGLPNVAAVDRPEIRLLYDLYYGAVAGEDTAATIGTRMGVLPLDQDLAQIRAQCYKGLFCLEYLPGASR